MEGYLDFSQANLFDPRWHAKVTLCLREYNDICEDRLMNLELQRVLTKLLMSTIIRDPSSVSKLSKREYSLFEAMAYKIMGLAKKTDKPVSELESAKQQWVSAFGDLDSPETKANIDAVVNWLMNR